MSPPKRQSVSRRGFLAGMAATSAAVGAFSLSARGADAVALPAAASVRPIGSATRGVTQRAGAVAYAAHSGEESTLRDQMTAARARDNAIRPFVVDVPEADLDDLRRRINAMKWPERELVADASQGVQLATTQALAKYWATDYDWRKMEAKLNALPSYLTEIDGLDIHFIHVRSKHEDALPMIVTHGWPGSIVEQLKIVEPLTDPTAYGGTAADAFHLVIPSMPGYGYSAKPTATGWDPQRIARAWAVLMQRLGYTRYVAQGGD